MNDSHPCFSPFDVTQKYQKTDAFWASWIPLVVPRVLLTGSVWAELFKRKNVLLDAVNTQQWMRFLIQRIINKKNHVTILILIFGRFLEIFHKMHKISGKRVLEVTVMEFLKIPKL